MKIVLALRNIADFRHMEAVVRHWYEGGHTVQIWIEEETKLNTTDRALRACLDYAKRDGQTRIGFHFVPFLQGEEGEGKSEDKSLLDAVGHRRDFLRNWMNYAFYFRRRTPTFYMKFRWRKHLPRWMRIFLHVPVLGQFMVSDTMHTLLRRLHDRSGLEESLLQRLRDDSPDVVVASPFIKRGYLEVETIRAAQMLHIPTVVAVQSWDNLTSRGLFHAVPDVLLLWNENLREEAVRLHEMPRERIVMTGAPTFDFWFEMQPQKTRDEFCAQVGLDAARPFFTYLGSSVSIAKREGETLKELARVLAEYSGTKDLQILVRPHPLNAKSFEGFECANVAVWPRAGDWPDAASPRQDYYDTLHHSMAVMGVNTSGFLDAAILDKPCLTALTEHYKHSQEGRAHFAHLMNADFIETAHSWEEAAQKLGCMMRGADEKALQRRAFVRRFIRPHGLGKEAAQLFARAVEMAAHKKEACFIESALKNAGCLEKISEQD